MIFAIPAGYELPEGAESGATVEALAELRITEDGQMELVSLDGVPMESEGDTETEILEDEAGLEMSMGDAMFPA